MLAIGEIEAKLAKLEELGVSRDDPRLAPIVALVDDVRRPRGSVYVYELDRWFDDARSCAKFLRVQPRDVTRAVKNDRVVPLPEQGICLHADTRRDPALMNTAALRRYAFDNDRLPNVWRSRCLWRVDADGRNCTMSRTDKFAPDAKSCVVCDPKSDLVLYDSISHTVVNGYEGARQLLGADASAKRLQLCKVVR